MNNKNGMIIKGNAASNFITAESRDKFWSVFLWFFVLFVFACSSRGDFAGIYRTDETKGQTVSEIELKADGEGIWRVDDYEETFTWYSKRKEIRLNTKKGGVIVAKIQGNTLDITLSGGKRLILVKLQ